MNENTVDFDKRIDDCAKPVIDQAGREVIVIFEADAVKIAGLFECTLRDVYIRAMEKNIWPMRYIRNRVSIGITEQIALARSRVAVIGAGGLGGYVLQLLARAGIGHLIIIDHGRFDESNLNRQILSDTGNVGQAKATVAASKLAEVNPAAETEAHPVSMTAENAITLVQSTHLAIDALDNMESRQVLHKACRKLKIPLVHGAISGFEGRLISLFPEDSAPAMLFSPAEELSSEAVLGTPAITPAIIASLQAMEAIKIILKRGRPFQGKMLYADLENGDFTTFSF